MKTVLFSEVTTKLVKFGLVDKSGRLCTQDEPAQECILEFLALIKGNSSTITPINYP